MGPSQRAADVQLRDPPRVTTQPPARAHGRDERQLLDQPADEGELVLAAGGEVLAGQPLVLADGGERAGVLVVLVLVGARARRRARPARTGAADSPDRCGSPGLRSPVGVDDGGAGALLSPRKSAMSIMPSNTWRKTAS